jgi:hypothetical protein
MSKFIRDLKRADIPTKTQRAQQIITACAAANTAIGDVTAELAAFTSANGTLDAKYDAAQTARSTAQNATDAQTGAAAAWDTALEDLLAKIESNTKGEKAKMGTTTVETFEPGAQSPAGAPPKVENVTVTDGDGSDDLDVSWNAIRSPRPRAYLVRMCEEPYEQTKMAQVGAPSASKFTKDGLTLGKTYWFEVCALGSGNQQGPWSNPGRGTVA